MDVLLQDILVLTSSIEPYTSIHKELLCISLALEGSFIGSIADAFKLAEQVGLPAWVQVDGSKLEGVFKKSPDRDEFGAEINESLIVELYSR